VAVAFDAVGPSAAGASAAAAASLTWAHTCGGSANAILAGASLGKTSATSRTLTATYAGTAMAGGAQVASGTSANGMLRVFTLLNPTTGTNNVVVTLDSTTGDLTGGSVSMTGAGSFASQYSATAASAGTNATATSAGSTSGGLIFASVVAGVGLTSATAPSTSRYIKNLNGSTAGGNNAGATSPSTGSAVTTAWTVSGADNWGVIGVEVLQAAAAGAIPAKRPVAQVAKFRSNYW
jgi:hypothetical protein